MLIDSASGISGDVAAVSVGGFTGAVVFDGGDLIKTGAGTLHLTNWGNTYSNTRIQSGMLIGSATSVRGNVENHGTIVFQQWADGTFDGSLFGDGVLEKRPARAAQVHGGRPRLPHANLPPKKNRPFPGGAKERG
ncbi:autotransporter-associated beta strand repeat-containing protein [Achromobacter insolitus]|uniref:autotransporter-associated beta strand repeat-containing protein n=1 Tax=Achromobacter insolitus TaxID=217204 RepID=UPI0016554B38|nr:autotransporter-associated beta strand repeat-containing protein [Achromobacter insolitus]